MMESNDQKRLRRQADGQVRRLMDHYLRAYNLPATDENASRFLATYECFMQAVPRGEQDAGRLDRLVRAALGIRDSAPGAKGGDAGQVTAVLEDLAARFSREQALRQEEAALCQRVQGELLRVEGTVTTLYGDLLDQLDGQQRRLAEREAQLVRQERETQTRLQSIQALESALKTALERRLHTEAHTLLDERVAGLAGELAAIRSELAEVGAVESLAGGGSDGPPLLAVIRRLKGEAEAAGIDPLTGLRTRERFEAELDEWLARFRQALASGDAVAENVALLHFHIDDFQGINERHGRSVGDAALQQVARILKTLRRGTDAAYRFGGAEMIVLLPRTPASGARNVAELLRRQIADLTVATPRGDAISLTVSAGGCDALSGGAAIASCAAQALCRAGQEGGNRTLLYSDDETLAALGGVVPAEFVAAVRGRLLRQEGFSVVAVKTTAADWLAELQRRVAARAPSHSSDADGAIFLLEEESDAKAALHAVEGDLEGIPARAVATDVSEVPPAAEASPGARAHALLTQLVEMLA